MQRRTLLKSTILLPFVLASAPPVASAADDTAAVQALIDAAWINGGAVQLEARDYYVAGLALPDGATRSLTIRGASRSYNDAAYAATKGGTRLICLTRDASAITFIGTSGLHRPTFTIEDLTILGTGDRANPGSGSGLRINGGTAAPIVLLKNVFVAWFYGGTGIWLSNCENGSVINTHTQLCDTGFRGDTAYNANAHVNVSAELCKTGILIENSESLSFAGGMVQSNEGNGLVLRNVSGVHFAGLHVENNNRLNTPDAWAILIEGATGVGFNQSNFIFPRDRVMVRGAVRGARFVGGKNIAASPAITLSAGVRGTRIDECVPAVSVATNGASGTRVIWDGVATTL
jgi:hypothetical protein